jgi:hypothetical protein
MFRLLIALMCFGAAVTTAGAQQPTAGAVPLGMPVGQTIADPRGQLSVDAFALTSVEVGPPVKDAPYSAQATTEIVQTLADGNRIVRRTSAVLYRDSRGRTRREVTLDAIAGIKVTGAPLRLITISDPESGMTYFMDANNQFIRSQSAPTVSGAAVRPPQVWTGQVSGGSSGQSGATVQAGGDTVQSGGLPLINTGAEREETLGTRDIDGISAQGTRLTLTIPAGAIGNERPIATVTERWFSPALRIVVFSRSSDPRFGVTTYRLTKVTRDEPPAALFEIPAR